MGLCWGRIALFVCVCVCVLACVHVCICVRHRRGSSSEAGRFNRTLTPRGFPRGPPHGAPPKKGAKDFSTLPNWFWGVLGAPSGRSVRENRARKPPEGGRGAPGPRTPRTAHGLLQTLREVDHHHATP